MTEDANLKGQEYSWSTSPLPRFASALMPPDPIVASIFYFGYLVSQFPYNLLIQRYPVGKLIGVAAVAWGGTVAQMGACHNAAGLMALRFLMGIFEAPMFPVCAVMTVMWYKEDEQPLRTAFWFGHWSSVSSDPPVWPPPTFGHAKIWLPKTPLPPSILNFFYL